MTGFRVGVDLDGVGYPFDFNLSRWIQMETGCSVLATPQSWDTHEWWDMELEEWLTHFARAVDAGFLFRHGRPYTSFVEGMIALKVDLHAEVHIVTDRGRVGNRQTAEESTRMWLDHWNIPYDTLTFTPDKTSVPVDTFIDDRLENYVDLELSGNHPYLQDRPWNQTADVERLGMDPAGMRRVSHFLEFVDRVRDLRLMAALS